MRITINGEGRESRAPTLEALVEEAGFVAGVVATAVNGEFVPRRSRGETALKDGDAVEVFAPRQGG